MYHPHHSFSESGNDKKWKSLLDTVEYKLAIPQYGRFNITNEGRGKYDVCVFVNRNLKPGPPSLRLVGRWEMNSKVVKTTKFYYTDDNARNIFTECVTLSDDISAELTTMYNTYLTSLLNHTSPCLIPCTQF
jgi:hypothetical protein